VTSRDHLGGGERNKTGVDAPRLIQSSLSIAFSIASVALRMSGSDPVMEARTNNMPAENH